MRRPSLILLSAVSVGLLLAGCGGGEKDSKSSGSNPDVQPGETITATWPMTGLEAAAGENVEKNHPVLVTKIDNTTSSSPQAGLGKADLVVEELVEGGLTRLAVFYYSQLPDRVGPVRSMRASDIGIVSPVHASVVTSGAAAQTIARIQKAGITFYQEGAKGIYRDSARPAPYNVFVNLKQLSTAAKTKASRPEDYLPWGAQSDLPKGKKARRISASFSGGHATEWVFQGGRYINTNTNAAADDQFPADSVLVLRVEVGDAGYLDPANNPVPETKVVGSGPALLFHGGRVVRGTWSKSALDGPLTLATKAGDLKVPAGHVWIELVPVKTGGVTFR